MSPAGKLAKDFKGGWMAENEGVMISVADMNMLIHVIGRLKAKLDFIADHVTEPDYLAAGVLVDEVQASIVKYYKEVFPN